MLNLPEKLFTGQPGFVLEGWTVFFWVSSSHVCRQGTFSEKRECKKERPHTTTCRVQLNVFDSFLNITCGENNSEEEKREPSSSSLSGV